MAAGESGGLGGQGSTTGIWRAIDASANRAGEALRVLEARQLIRVEYGGLRILDLQGLRTASF
jgi:hypothetical protein